MPPGTFPQGIPEALLFDLDGTLVDTAPGLTAAVNDMLAGLGRAPRREAEVRAWVGEGARVLVERALAASPSGTGESDFEAAYAAFLDCYAERLTHRAAAYAGVPETLAELRRRGCPLGCVTNKPERFTRPLLEALDLARYLDVVVSGDTLGVKKPDPAPLRHATAALGTSPAASWMVGDSAIDAAAARAAGCVVIWVSYGYAGPGERATARPDGVVDSLAELCELFH